LAAEKIAVIGAGIGGLAVALELDREAHDVTIIERDPPPPDIPPESAFEDWQRPGVPQFRHAHILLSRLRTAIRDRHPALLDELLKAGLYLSTLEEVLPAGVTAPPSPMPEDDDLLHLWGRRATFEFVLRRYVSGLPNVRFVTDTRVVGLVADDEGDSVKVRGLSLSSHGETETLPADVVVDASGKRSKCGEWLEALGVTISSRREESGFVYSCRHYRLKDPASAPPRRDGGGSLDYLGYSLFYQEHGNYSLTFGCPESEEELADTMRTKEGFEALAQQFPVVKRWVDASEPTTKVLGAGRFENRWTVYGAPGGKKLTGFFAVGDSHFETNPMYGRGCSAAFVQARVLAESLALTTPEARAQRYEQTSRRLLQPYYDISVSTDRVYHMRAKLRRGLPISGPDRLLNYLYEYAWLPATHSSLFVAREFLRAVQMREISALWIRLAVGLRILVALVRSWLGYREPRIVTPPPRAEFLRNVSGVRREIEHEPG
jgi:2-polyprenyl-6-methoxyphenol hydroxylase-like FAD-dependent oxidoreductase